MNHIQSRISGFLSLLLLLSVPLFGQGFTWESTLTTADGDMPEFQTVSSYRPRMFRQTTGAQSTILRLDKKVFYMIDGNTKEYSEMTFAEMEARFQAAGKAMEQKMAGMTKQLESLPADQRKMVEQMMGGKLKGTNQKTDIKVTKTGEKKTISGYACTKYVIAADGKEFGTVWTTTAIPEFAAMKEDFLAFSQHMAEQSSFYGKQLAAGMKNVEGFPIQTTIANMTTTVTKCSKQAVPAADFEIPAGYTKVQPADMEEKEEASPDPVNE